MNLPADYWMLPLIRESVCQKRTQFGTETHRGCDVNCTNRWCPLGQCNIVINRIDELTEQIETEFRAEGGRGQ